MKESVRLEKEVRKMEGKFEMTTRGGEWWAWHGRLSDLPLPFSSPSESSFG